MNPFFNDYIACIEANIKPDRTYDEMDFKSDPRYRSILEHVSFEQGQAYLDAIKTEFGYWFETHKNHLIEWCKANDEVGKPVQYEYEGFSKCSPTDLRYIQHAYLILTHMMSNKLDRDDLRVVEIGGGYGGLCFFLLRLASLMSVNISEYRVFDLDAVVELQKTYLDHHGIKVIPCKLGDELPQSYLISDYALGEMPKELQSEYISKVVDPYCPWGFLTWNGEGTLGMDGAHRETEYPLTGDNHFIFYS